MAQGEKAGGLDQVLSAKDFECHVTALRLFEKAARFIEASEAEESLQSLKREIECMEGMRDWKPIDREQLGESFNT